MNERASPSYVISVLLHGAVIAIILLLAYIGSQSRPETPQIFDLVAGVGNNFQGTEATKLGAENGIELHLPAVPVVTAPTPPAPEPTPAEPAPIVPAEPAPVAAPVEVAPAPVAKPAAKPKHALPANPMVKSMVKAEIRTESAAKQKAAKLEKARKRAEALEKARTSYDAFVKSQGLAKGKAGGVAAGTSMADGAGGHALTAAMHDAMEGWISLLILRWKDGFVPPADFNQRMQAEVSFHVAANGVISAIHVHSSNGGPDFESAVADALRHVSMPAPPNGKGDNYNVTFSLQDQEQ